VREVLQDHFHHVLGAGIRAERAQRGFLCDHEARHHVINRRGGAEYHARVTQFAQELEEGHGFDHIVAVIVIRAGDGFRDDDERGAVDGGEDIRMVREDLAHHGAVSDIRLVEDPTARELTPAGNQ